MVNDENYTRQKLRLTNSPIRYLRENLISKLLISFWYVFVRKMIRTVDSLYLEHPLSRTSCELKIKRVHCMINISQVNGTLLQILESLRHRHYKLGWSWKKTASCRKLLVLWTTLRQTIKNFIKSLFVYLNVFLETSKNLWRPGFYVLVSSFQINTYGPWMDFCFKN